MGSGGVFGRSYSDCDNWRFCVGSAGWVELRGRYFCLKKNIIINLCSFFYVRVVMLSSCSKMEKFVSMKKFLSEWRRRIGRREQGIGSSFPLSEGSEQRVEQEQSAFVLYCAANPKIAHLIARTHHSTTTLVRLCVYTSFQLPGRAVPTTTAGAEQQSDHVPPSQQHEDSC